MSVNSMLLAGGAAVLAGVIAQDATAVSAVVATLQKVSPPTLYALAAFVGVLVLFLLSLPRGGEGKGKGAVCPATAWPTGKPVTTDPSTYPVYDSNDPKGSFYKVNTMLIEEMCGELGSGYELPEPEVKWVRDMLEYNVCGGKMNRGLMVVECGREMFKATGQPMTNEMLVKFAILGWCVEWLQAWLLVADDFMDDSQTRRGQSCWYLLPTVKKIAINDAFMIEMLIFKIMKRHFGNEPYYLQLLDLMLETTFQTECGQLLDTLCMNLDLPDFTLPRWTLIVKYKTAFYSFYLPVAMGMIVAGVSEQKEFDAARDILMIMGVYFQAQDDYLDCYGTPEQLGKIGTDIQDKKCGWLFANAYHEGLCTPAQKTLLQKTYGKCKVFSDEEKAIKELYTAIKLPELYAKYEKNSYDKIMALKGTTKQVPWTVFEIFVNKIYKRSK
ncbi:isoprenoid synthase domain-containing protein [Pavlovales sp. CCMP2436]|nr:isoprenoid synthase domain-containing protein [Pavlovales sp. CCMP2436]